MTTAELGTENPHEIADLYQRILLPNFRADAQALITACRRPGGVPLVRVSEWPA